MQTKKMIARATGVIGFVLAGMVAGQARAALIYENISGVGLIYDTVTNATWTRDGNLSGQVFDNQDANAWAAALSIPGLPGVQWRLAGDAEFTSLYTQLAPYGAPGTPGTDDRYGASVAFGNGPNDSALNVQPEYWTNLSGVDFNFFYGFTGARTNDLPFAAWAMTTSVVPEPSTAVMVFGGVGSWLISARALRTRRACEGAKQ